MDSFAGIIATARELVVPLVVFFALLMYSVIRGQRALTSILLSLYFALLFSIKFPYYALFESKLTFLSAEGVRMVTFGAFTALCTILVEKILSRLLDETAFEGIAKKVILALLATMLLMAYSYHVLHIPNLTDPSSKLATIFGPQDYFFWWLVIPLVGLFFIF